MTEDKFDAMRRRAFDMYEKAVQEQINRALQISTLNHKLDDLRASKRKHDKIVAELENVLRNIASHWPPESGTNFTEGFLD